MGPIGCGYYLGHLSTCPYVIATGTTGVAFEAELLNIVGNASAAGAAAEAGHATRAQASRAACCWLPLLHAW